MIDAGLHSQPVAQGLPSTGFTAANEALLETIEPPAQVMEVSARKGWGPLAARDIELSLQGDLAAVEVLWRAFENDASHTFFQTFAWLEAWQRHVGKLANVAPAIVSGKHPDGTLIFILPLAIHKRRSVRHLTFLGSDLCDYNAPLLHQEFRTLVDDAGFAALWTRIVDLLRADRRFAFDVIDLAKMPEQIGNQRNPLLVLATKANPSGAHFTKLTGTWEEFYARKRSSATRRKERKQLRQLGEFGEIRFVDRLEGEERARTLDILFEQKAQSFARMGVRNIFLRPGYRGLFIAFATDEDSRDLVHLSRLEVGPTIAAASIGFTTSSCYYLVLSSYQSSDMARLGPGRTHLHELLRYAIESGRDCFDFTIGDELYKRDWSDTRVTLQDHLQAATWRGAVAVSLITGFRAAKRSIKQNAFTWRLFSRTRSLVGSISSRQRPSALVAGAQEAPARTASDASPGRLAEGHDTGDLDA